MDEAARLRRNANKAQMELQLSKEENAKLKLENEDLLKQLDRATNEQHDPTESLSARVQKLEVANKRHSHRLHRRDTHRRVAATESFRDLLKEISWPTANFRHYAAQNAYLNMERRPAGAAQRDLITFDNPDSSSSASAQSSETLVDVSEDTPMIKVEETEANTTNLANIAPVAAIGENAVDNEHLHHPAEPATQPKERWVASSPREPTEKQSDVFTAVMIHDIPAEISLDEILSCIRGGDIVAARFMPRVGDVPSTETRQVVVHFAYRKEAVAYVWFCKSPIFEFHLANRQMSFKVKVGLAPFLDKPVEKYGNLWERLEKKEFITRVLHISDREGLMVPDEMVKKFKGDGIQEPLRWARAMGNIIIFEFAGMHAAMCAHDFLNRKDSYKNCRKGFFPDPCEKPLESLSIAEKDDTVYYTPEILEDLLRSTKKVPIRVDGTSGESMEGIEFSK